MTTQHDATAWYADFFKHWPKQAGPKPTADQLEAIHGLGLREGGKEPLACAMALRECGVTGSQIVLVCGAPQLNRMRGLITDKLLLELPASPDANQNPRHRVYKLVISPKGQKRVDAAAKRKAEVLAEANLETPAGGSADAGVNKALAKAFSKAKAPKAKAEPKVSKPRKSKAADALPASPFIAVNDEGEAVALPVDTEMNCQPEHHTELPPVDLGGDTGNAE